jgi:hypothetical protein
METGARKSEIVASNQFIELMALKSECDGMCFENRCCEANGRPPLYRELQFAKIAEKMRALKIEDPAAKPDAPSKVMVWVGEVMFQFKSYRDWYDNAQNWFNDIGKRNHQFICIDCAGRVCTTGQHSRRADDDGTFPITVYAIE